MTVDHGSVSFNPIPLDDESYDLLYSGRVVEHPYHTTENISLRDAFDFSNLPASFESLHRMLLDSAADT